MTEQRRFPYGGVPVYNPQSLSKTEALAQFHARQAAYLSLMDLLREERPSHVLIIGTRGMGKTTLLQRVRYGVEEDAELNSRYLVLAYPEEQYNVNRLYRFLLNTVDALADAMERLKNERMLKRVEEYAEVVGKCTPEEIEERVPQFLAEITQQMQKSLLLLVDNADRLFEVIEDRQQWRLRELLSSRRDLTFFGATTQASDGIYGPERAFFEFFKIHRLAPLTFVEVRDLLLRLSESVEEKEGEKGSAKRRVAEWLDADAARLRTLVQLTGGNPRTTVLLFHLVLDGLAGGAREYLEQLLDQVTPTYKGRVDELPAQAQQVLDAVAIRWDPVIAVEVAEDTGLETSVVSTYLTRLVRQGILEKADAGDSKKALYQVAERFFNIWYLMRASRRVRAKLRWFVEFLRVFFDSGELEQMAWKRIRRYQRTWRGHPEEIETAFAYVLASGAGRDRFEDYLRQKCADTEEMWRPYLELLTDALGNKVTTAVEASVSHDPTSPDSKALAAIKRVMELDPDSSSTFAKLLESWKQNAGAAIHEATSEPNRADLFSGLANLLRKAIELEPESAWLCGALGGVLSLLPTSHDEAETACRKAIELDPKFARLWNTLGDLLAKAPERVAEAEAAYRKAIELDPELARFWSDLGDLLAKAPERVAEAEAAYRKAIELSPKFAGFWDDLGDLLAGIPERTAEAEAAYRKAIELNPESAHFWDDLGDLLVEIPERTAEAEAAYRRAIELDPKCAWFWSDLGVLLGGTPGRRAEEEAAYRRATELDPGFAGFWYELGSLLAKTSERIAEAEAAYRKAIDLDPTSAMPWNGLADLLARIPERKSEAEIAYRKAIQLDPEIAWFWDDLGSLLAEKPERAADAEAAYRAALELEPKDAMLWGSLGFVLACQAGRPRDAEVAFRNSVQFEPDNPRGIRNLGVLLYCELAEPEEAVVYLGRAYQLDPGNPVSGAILAAALRDPETPHEQPRISIDAARGAGFWDELLELCRNYAPFGKILLGICDLVQEGDNSNRFAPLYRAVALAQLGDFPRASVALEDALIGDPIDLLSIGQRALETFLAAAVKSGRVRDCREVIDKKDWKDAWRPIYEALRAVEADSAEYLKRIAIEIRVPAMVILRRIAPQVRDLAEREG
jgi:tetratricopeptide (TPR) repeat protein/AAA+ ATPase superfamily predicted ATPase